MIDLRLSLILSILAIAAVPVPLTQVVPSAEHPMLAGTWAPSEPEQSDKLFDLDFGLVPGQGRLIIEQRPDRLTVTKEVPDDLLDKVMAVTGPYGKTTVYRIVVPRGRSGGFGAAGDQRASSWQGDRLVLEDSRASIPYTIAFSLEGDRLKLERHVVIRQGRETNRVEWFTRAK